MYSTEQSVAFPEEVHFSNDNFGRCVGAIGRVTGTDLKTKREVKEKVWIPGKILQMTVQV